MVSSRTGLGQIEHGRTNGASRVDVRTGCGGLIRGDQGEFICGFPKHSLLLYPRSMPVCYHQSL